MQSCNRAIVRFKVGACHELEKQLDCVELRKVGIASLRTILAVDINTRTTDDVAKRPTRSK